MPLNLDSCITGIFVPGNIGASSGLPPVVRVMPPRAPATFDVQVDEVTTATDLTDQQSVAATLAETAAAADVVGTTDILAGARDAMLPGVFVTSDGTLREAYVDGVMVNL